MQLHLPAAQHELDVDAGVRGAFEGAEVHAAGPVQPEEGVLDHVRGDLAQRKFVDLLNVPPLVAKLFEFISRFSVE